MPDLLNRHSHEERFAYGLAAELSRERRRLVAYGVERLPQRPAVDWENDKDELAAILLLLLRDPWYSSYYGLAGGEGVIARATDIEAAYQRWAAEYADETAKQITDNTKEIALAAAVLMMSGANVPFQPTGGATSTIPTTSTTTTLPPFPQANLFAVADDKRIVRGAISMVTDAASGGEFAVAREFERQEEERIARVKQAIADRAKGSDGGAADGGTSIFTPFSSTTASELERALVKRTLVAYWHTEDDGRVCGICRPLNGKPASEWKKEFPNGPKAHVACRCYLDWRVE